MVGKMQQLSQGKPPAQCKPSNSHKDSPRPNRKKCWLGGRETAAHFIAHFKFPHLKRKKKEKKEGSLQILVATWHGISRKRLVCGAYRWGHMPANDSYLPKHLLSSSPAETYGSPHQESWQQLTWRRNCRGWGWDQTLRCSVPLGRPGARGCLAPLSLPQVTTHSGKPQEPSHPTNGFLSPCTGSCLQLPLPPAAQRSPSHS